jgi:signal transduction histidine kinase
MNAYVWVLLVACAGSALAAGTILARDAASPANRRAALLSLCASYWAACEIAWNTASDPAAVLLLVKLSAPGWIFVGPMAMDVLLAATEDVTARDRRALRVLYTAASAMLLIEWTTPWIHPAVARTSWGWAYEFGPLFPAFYSITLTGVTWGIWRAGRHFVRTASPGERKQGGWVLAAIAIPLLTGSLTDGLLPFLGFQPPRFGTLSLALLSATITWSIHRYGYSLLAPGRFAPEILDALSDGVVLVRLNGDVRIANRAMGELVGRDAASLVGARVAELLPSVPTREVDNWEGELQAAPDRRIPVSISSSILRDKAGLPLGVVLVVRDMREVVDLRSRLVISSRLAAVGELAAGIAHEINNPIAYVRSNLSLLAQHWQTLGAEVGKTERGPVLAEVCAEGDELIAESLGGVDRVAEIVRDVKGISHAGGGQRRLVSLNPILERVVRVAGHQIDPRIETRFADLPLILAAPQELEQVFLNLLLNAGQAIRSEGRIRIETAVEGSRVVALVEDDGEGIPPENLPRIFDPFFTTKPQGEGTGLGLAISYQIVRKHGGEITVASERGKGTVFRVGLPVAELD